MQRNLKDIFLEILNIINYSKDKDKFFKEFEELNHTEAMLNILERLPLETQERIKAIKDQQEVIEAIQKHVTREEYVPELIKVSNQALGQFLKDIEHTLSVDQKQKIAKLLQ